MILKMRFNSLRLFVAVLGVAALPSVLAQTASSSLSCGNVTALQASVTDNPRNADALIKLGEAQLCLGRAQKSRILFETARDHLESASNINGKSFEARFLLGQAYYELGDFDAAILEFAQLTKLFPDRADAFYQLGVVHARIRKTDDAITAFNTAAQLAKTNRLEISFQRDVNVALAGQLLIKRDYASAAAAFKAAQEFAPNETELQVSEAQAWFDANRNTEALDVVNRVLAKDRGNVSAAWLIASIYEKEKQLDRAVRELNRSLVVVTAPKERAVLLLKRGLVESTQGKTNASLETLRQAVANDGTLFEARYAYALALLSNNNPKAAFEQFRVANSLRPGDGEVQLGLANAQNQIGNNIAAYQNAQAAIRLLATDPARVAAARYVAGRSAYLAALSSGNTTTKADLLRKATIEFRALIVQDAANAEYRYWLGLTLLQRKEYTAAIESLIEAVKLAPNNLEIRIALSAAYMGAKRFSDAEIAARDVVKAAPNNADAWFNLGLALLNQGRTAEGKKAVQNAARLGNQAAKELLKKL
jgi:tetratricopeptide (TPR) repeat protein